MTSINLKGKEGRERKKKEEKEEEREKRKNEVEFPPVLCYVDQPQKRGVWILLFQEYVITVSRGDVYSWGWERFETDASRKKVERHHYKDTGDAP